MRRRRASETLSYQREVPPYGLFLVAGWCTLPIMPGKTWLAPAALQDGKNPGFKMAAVFKPIIRWAQSKERVFLTLELSDVQV